MTGVDVGCGVALRLCGLLVTSPDATPTLRAREAVSRLDDGDLQLGHAVHGGVRFVVEVELAVVPDRTAPLSSIQPAGPCRLYMTSSIGPQWIDHGFPSELSGTSVPVVNLDVVGIPGPRQVCDLSS